MRVSIAEVRLQCNARERGPPMINELRISEKSDKMRRIFARASAWMPTPPPCNKGSYPQGPTDAGNCTRIQSKPAQFYRANELRRGGDPPVVLRRDPRTGGTGRAVHEQDLAGSDVEWRSMAEDIAARNSPAHCAVADVEVDAGAACHAAGLTRVVQPGGCSPRR